MAALRGERPELTDQLKENHNKHKDKYGREREPILNGLTSDIDLELFREAQAKACGEMVKYTRGKMLNMY